MDIGNLKLFIEDLIALTESLYEEFGQDGDSVMATQFDEDSKVLKRGLEELNTLANTTIYSPFIQRVLKDYEPSLDKELLDEYLGIMISRKTQELETLKSRIKDYSNLQDALNSYDSNS